VDDSLQKVRFAVLLRTARVAIGWNQQEFADLLGVAKSSITRMETVEMAMPSIFAMRAMQLFRENGIEFDIFSVDSTSVIITEKALQIAKSRLEDQTLRRSDMIPKKNKKISKKSVDAD
jgi:transcriptional regulator with XRE-family HTH domain